MNGRAPHCLADGPTAPPWHGLTNQSDDTAQQFLSITSVDFINLEFFFCLPFQFTKSPVPLVSCLEPAPRPEPMWNPGLAASRLGLVEPLELLEPTMEWGFGTCRVCSRAGKAVLGVLNGALDPSCSCADNGVISRLFTSSPGPDPPTGTAVDPNQHWYCPS